MKGITNEIEVRILPGSFQDEAEVLPGFVQGYGGKKTGQGQEGQSR